MDKDQMGTYARGIITGIERGKYAVLNLRVDVRIQDRIEITGIGSAVEEYIGGRERLTVTFELEPNPTFVDDPETILFDERLLELGRRKIDP